MVDYNFKTNSHTLAGAKAGCATLFAEQQPASLLDVGCGIGTWLRAALEQGITDIYGLDGMAIPPEQLLIPPHYFHLQDLTETWSLNRRFDALLCLEVGEHLEARFAEHLIRNLSAHSDTIFFSAACPDQIGHHHVNCQWPVYWQELFNRQGYVCDDSIRWKIWHDSDIEPWYRQNIFVARLDPAEAGQERRLPAVIHPQMLYAISNVDKFRPQIDREIENGGKSLGWYFRILPKVISTKIARRLQPQRAKN